MTMVLIITLIVLGIILLLAELMLIPGFGIAGIAGALSLAGGVVLAYSHGAVTGHIALSATLIISAALTGYALQSKTWKRLSLDENITAQALETPQQKGLAVGMQGTSLTRLAPMGTVTFGEVETEAASYDNQLIAPKQPVEIVKLEGSKIMVKIIH